jgi:hypothetical protein
VGIVKRGQITIFIIIGIIMLILVSFFIYVGTREKTREVEIVIPEIAKVSKQSQPVFDHVQSCIGLIAKEGIKLIGARGGYLDTEFPYNPFDPTAAEAVQFSQGGDLIVPYWYHMTSPNSCTSNCQFTENIPKLYTYEGEGSIETQLGRYVSANLKSCIDFSAFEQQGVKIVELTKPVIKATITPTNVFFSGNYDLRIEREGLTTEISEYYVPVDVNLQQAYELAVDVTSLESQEYFLETSTREIISLFSGMGKDQLPPLTAFRLSFDAPEYWLQYEAQEDAERLLTSYLSLLRASGTRNFRYNLAGKDVRDPLLYEAVYDRQFFIPLNKSYPDYSLQFAYLPWWNSYFDMNCNGELCTAESADMPLAFLIGMRQYRFQYDISYPVLVALNDPTAFNGDGFTFQFFLETNMRNNNPLQGLDILPAFQGREPTILCNPDQFTSGEVKFAIRDKVSKLPVDASIVYRCGPETCNIGQAENGELLTKLPECISGVLIVTSPNYMQQARLIDSIGEANRSILFELLPSQKINVTASKFLMMKYGKHGQWKLEPQSLPENVDSDETVIILLKRHKETPFDSEYSAFAEITGTESSEMQIMPGVYTLRINSIKYPVTNVTIPVDRRCEEFGVWPFDDEVCYNIPDEPMTFNEENPLPYGGAEYNITISPGTLKNAKLINFKYIAVGVDQVPEQNRVMEDMNEFAKIKAYSRAIKNKLKPVIR